MTTHRQPNRGLLAAGLVSALTTLACTADRPQQVNPPHPDGGTEGTLRPPMATGVPSATPDSTVAIRGTTDGSAIIVQGGPTGSQSVAVLPGGNFCIDAALAAGRNVFLIYALDGNGAISSPATVVTNQDPSASSPSDPTCSGQVAQCSATEICGNGKDDDCDGWTDACDTHCNGCVDDYLEPNNYPLNVPSLEAGTYSNLEICPCRDDWIAFHRLMGGTVHAKVTFNALTVDINLKLFRASDAEKGVFDAVASSTTSSSAEEIQWTVDKDGTYYLKVYATRKSGTGKYTLKVF
jgi:hypothetical protein